VLYFRNSATDFFFFYLKNLPPFIFPQGGKVLILLPLWGKVGKGVID
jgi:hypothetical protein